MMLTRFFVSREKAMLGRVVRFKPVAIRSLIRLEPSHFSSSLAPTDSSLLDSIGVEPLLLMPAGRPPIKVGALALESARTLARQRKSIRDAAPFLTEPFEKWPLTWGGSTESPVLQVLRPAKHDSLDDFLAIAQLPDIIRKVFRPPKGFEDSVSSSTVAFDAQRARSIREALKMMHIDAVRAGTLASGPNGVGKTAISYLSAVTLFTLGLPLIYIPTSEFLVSRGFDDFSNRLMLEFFRCNADLLLKEEFISYRPMFRHLLEDQPDLTSPQNFIDFAYLLGLPPSMNAPVPPCALVIDEMQIITDLARLTSSPSPSQIDSTSSSFQLDRSAFSIFLGQQFCRWTGMLGSFRSQLTASSHGLREFTLPDGERKRIRFIQPFQSRDMVQLLETKGSPFYHETTAAIAKELVDAFGGVPRRIRAAVDGIISSASPKSSKASILKMLKSEVFDARGVMAELSEVKWWHGLANFVQNRLDMIDIMFEVLRGDHRFRPDIKPLYDFGLLYVDRNYVRPTSALAKSVLGSTLAKHYAEEIPLSRKMNTTLQDPSEYGYAFQDLLIASIAANHFRRLPISVYRLQSLQHGDYENARRMIHLSGDSIFPMTSVDDINDNLPACSASIWIPSARDFPVDCIIVPQNLDEPIVLLESSRTDPMSSSRRESKGLNISAPSHPGESGSSAVAARDSESMAISRGIVDIEAQIKQKFGEYRKTIIVLALDLPVGTIKWRKNTLQKVPDNCFLLDGESCQSELRIPIDIEARLREKRL